MRYIQAVIFLVFLAAIGVFALQNRDVITVKFQMRTSRNRSLS